MYDFENMSPSDHEEVSVIFLIKFRDTYEERIATQEIKPTDLAEERSVMIEDLLFAYFESRRNYVPIPVPDKNLTCQQLVDFINDEILVFISEERPELFEYDPESGKYHMLFDDNDD